MLPVHKAFRHCPSCGQARSDEANPLTCACGFRFYFNPASAVAALLSDPDGNMLFTRRERDPGKGMLGLPGGFIDAGESGEDAARREVEEEVGLQIGNLTYLMSHPNTYAYGGVLYHVIDFFYTATVPHFEGIDSDPSEVREWFIARPKTMCGGDFAFVSNWRAVEFSAHQ